MVIIMKKLTVVINGSGGVGKDTVCEFAASKYQVRNVSSVTPVKKIAGICGWDGSKDDRSRKFLSDLKQLLTDYNDYPNRYIVEEHKKFLQSEEDVMFVHIREGEQIQHFCESIGNQCVTLLIRRNLGKVHYGNRSDDEVELISYDYVYENNLPLNEAKADFLDFFAKILEQSGIES
ncbi:MAG: hypothetical protein ACI4C1_06430 [Lachnospiraceae bacterium]